ncbi:hypothetical protein [Mycobacterium sp. PSTR-4-N]|uniref:hypothetical protein n=1 Tax=Mycobacterium sp. PSTR-4-N TaxID=2917745 RepID=UPI001F153553|nr:hypothetical protein [Mycobacterium sp. PSTR-4-N]MCG7595671.1 hypothetical protein [Mycobacterium sp. PSTR-4-N]
MTSDADVTKASVPAGARDARADSAAESDPAQTPIDSPSATSPAPQQRTWSMPKSPVTRQHVDDMGRGAVKISKSLISLAGRAARSGARILAQMARAVAAIPPAARLLFLTSTLLLLGFVGALVLDGTPGLLCIIVVIPVCAAVLGALGYRWYSGLGMEGAAASQPRPIQPAKSDLERSVDYVDRKLALALTSLGTDHHQQAVIALFQAKTAVELTLGTEQDLDSYADMTMRPDDYGLRPRIGAGSSSTSTPREDNSRAAS